MKQFLVLCTFLLLNGISLAAEKTSSPEQIIEIKVTENGFEPRQIEVKSEIPVVLKVTRETNNTCATEIKMKELKIKKDLPLNQSVSIHLGKLKKGEHRFNCAMNMISGTLLSK